MGTLYYFYRNLKPKRFIWNEIVRKNAVGDHRHKFQFGSIGVLIDHTGSPATWPNWWNKMRDTYYENEREAP